MATFVGSSMKKFTPMEPSSVNECVRNAGSSTSALNTGYKLRVLAGIVSPKRYSTHGCTLAVSASFHESGMVSS